MDNVKKVKSTKKLAKAVSSIIQFQKRNQISSLTIMGDERLADLTIDKNNHVSIYFYNDLSKENKLESVSDLLVIDSAENGTDNTTKLNVLHDKQKEQLIAGVGELIKIVRAENNTKDFTSIEVLEDMTKVSEIFDLNKNGLIEITRDGTMVYIGINHDNEKEQVIEGKGELIEITHAENGSGSKTLLEVLEDKNKISHITYEADKDGFSNAEFLSISRDDTTVSLGFKPLVTRFYPIYTQIDNESIRLIYPKTFTDGDFNQFVYDCSIDLIDTSFENFENDYNTVVLVIDKNKEDMMINNPIIMVSQENETNGFRLQFSLTNPFITDLKVAELNNRIDESDTKIESKISDININSPLDTIVSISKENNNGVMSFDIDSRLQVFLHPFSFFGKPSFQLYTNQLVSKSIECKIENVIVKPTSIDSVDYPYSIYTFDFTKNDLGVLTKDVLSVSFTDTISKKSLLNILVQNPKNMINNFNSKFTSQESIIKDLQDRVINLESKVNG